MLRSAHCSSGENNELATLSTITTINCTRQTGAPFHGILASVTRSSIGFTPIGRRGMRVTLHTDKGWLLEAAGDVDQALPEFSGAVKLQRNLVLAVNLWAFACAEKERRITRDNKLRTELERRAKVHSELTRSVADLVEAVGDETRSGWCSACFEHTAHCKVDAGPAVPTWLCDSCGAATLRCAAPGCDNMATRSLRKLHLPRYCGEHRHDIPSFERGSSLIDELSNYSELWEFDKPNLAKITKVATTGLLAAGAMTGVGLAAAPLIGGFIGTTVGGYSGAAATSYGLALLGGGSVASGGLGMAGGTAVVGAIGASLGGAAGAAVTHAYVSEDNSFSIEKLQDGPGIAVVVCSGFLTEGKSGWGDWERIVTARYPDSPVYRVHWGAQELADLGFVMGLNAGKAAIAQVVKAFAARASRQAAKVAGPVGAAFIVADLVKNPWWRARERANKTGAVVADLIARTNMDEVVLIGHSLGARAMLCAAEALGTKASAPSVREIHLLGAAVGAKGDWSPLNSAVERHVFNYHSRDDTVLKFFYSIIQGGHRAAGYSGMVTKQRKIQNIDVTGRVRDHSAYCKQLTLK